MKKIKLKPLLLLVIILLIAVLIAYKAAWIIRSNQYREYGARELQKTVANCLIRTPGDIKRAEDSGKSAYLENLAYRFFITDGIRVKLRNTYLNDDPGGFENATSVWTSCGRYLLELCEKYPDLTEKEVSFLKDLSDLCQTHIEVFDTGFLSINDFEYDLNAFEDELEALMTPIEYPKQAII